MDDDIIVNNYEDELHLRVSLFRKWAKENYPTITESSDNGEWCFCDEFYDMCHAAVELIKHVSACKATEQMLDDVLYCIARDNECSDIMDDMIDDNDEWFSLLCRKCLDTNYTNAKWQFVEHLPIYKGTDNLQKIIYEYIEVEDEYTERLALKALADIYPQSVEKYAVEFWERDKYRDDQYREEYQKIMVLCVLEQVKSTKLPYYLDLAKKSGYKYLIENAEKIESRMKGSAL